MELFAEAEQLMDPVTRPDGMGLPRVRVSRRT